MSGGMFRDREICWLAEECRRAARQSSPAYSTRHLVEASFPNALVTGRDLPDGVHEVVTLTAHGPLVLYQRKLSTAEQRFAIAHALGHLHRDFFNGKPVRTFGDPASEQWADDFAAELLVPLVELEQRVEIYPEEHTPVLDGEIYRDHVDEIASLFQVTAVLIDQRIRQLAARTFLSSAS